MIRLNEDFKRISKKYLNEDNLNFNDIDDGLAAEDDDECCEDDDENNIHDATFLAYKLEAITIGDKVIYSDSSPDSEEIEFSQFEDLIDILSEKIPEDFKWVDYDVDRNELGELISFTGRFDSGKTFTVDIKTIFENDEWSQELSDEDISSQFRREIEGFIADHS